LGVFDFLKQRFAKKKKAKPISALTLGEGSLIEGRFAIKGLLGIGGTSAVYVAEQVSMGRDVALKVLKSEFTWKEHARMRFLKEVRAVSRLTNPHCVSIFDVGETEEGLLFIAMELLRGRSLFRVMVEDGIPMSASRIVGIMMQVLDCLEEAHKAQVVHGDLKPENIFIVEGPGHGEFAKVLDFGIAQFEEERNVRKGKLSVVVGTPQYMSPEQMEGQPLEPTTDIYAVATILFEAISGRAPFEADNAVALGVKKLTEDPPMIRDINPLLSVPEELDELIHKALSKDKTQRPQTALEFKNLLALALEGHVERERRDAKVALRATKKMKALDVTGKQEEPPRRAEEQFVVEVVTGEEVPQAQGGDRRQTKRIQKMISATILCKDRTFKATTTDISVSGAFFHSKELPNTGEVVECIFENIQGRLAKVHLSGTVVRVSETANPVRGFALKWLFLPGETTPLLLHEIFGCPLE
jgi:serine/threonine protein kinase